ncbi:MAG: hypothetical protein LIO94_09155 [Clostridiales bacterium]|nr:hypothetical protein [Clostridiales bacterium]
MAGSKKADSKEQKEVASQAKASHEKDWLDASKPLNKEHQKMLEWLKMVKFRRTLINGVDEADVWRKIEELNHLYEGSLIAERASHEAILDKYVLKEAELVRYKMAVKNIKKRYDEMVEKNKELQRQLEFLGGKKADSQSDSSSCYSQQKG